MSKIIDESKIENLRTKGNPHCSAGKAPERASWRTFKPVIDYKKCIKCYMCWLHCPDAAYNINEEGFPVCDGTTCKGCLICKEVCPVKCISSEREKRE